MNKLHMTIDIETFSQAPTAAIISIGACTFDKTGVKDTFKVNIKPESAKAFGMTISKDTVDWWSKQSKEAQEESLSRGVNADFALQQFVDWYKEHKPTKIWAQGVSFDCPIMENALKCVNVKQPWKYYQWMDSRTLFELFGVTTEALHASEGSMHHGALSDAITQTKGVITILNALGWSEEDGPLKV